MLGKLFKYDMKALSRYLVPLHLLVLLVSIAGRFLVTSKITQSPSALLTGLALLTYISIILIVGTATYLIVVIHFYKNLFTTEGYLTLTLPATPAQHLNAKFFSGLIWFAIDMIVIVLSLVILFATPDIWKYAPEIEKAFLAELNISASNYCLSLIGLFLIGTLVNPLYLFVCVAIGQLFSNHRVLGAVVVYFVITMILQLGMTAFMIGSGALPMGFGSSANHINFQINFSAYFGITFKLSIISVIIEGIGSYVVTHYILKRKLNLN